MNMNECVLSEDAYMKQRHNNRERRYDLVVKRLKSLSRRSLAILEDSILDDGADPEVRMQSAKTILELNNQLFEMENIGLNCSIATNG